MAVPSGEPNTVAAVRPARTTASARPRCAAGTSSAATPPAVGTIIAPPSPATARPASTAAYHGSSADPAVPAANTAKPVTSTVRRRQDAVAAAMTGDRTA